MGLHIVDDYIFRMYPLFHAKQDSLSGNTMPIHLVFESGHLCNSRFGCRPFWLVMVFVDNTIDMLLLEKWRHLWCPLCTVRAIEYGDGDDGQLIL
jgi:hypothetical protein